MEVLDHEVLGRLPVSYLIRLAPGTLRLRLVR